MHDEKVPNSIDWFPFQTVYFRWIWLPQTHSTLQFCFHFSTNRFVFFIFCLLHSRANANVIQNKLWLETGICDSRFASWSFEGKKKSVDCVFGVVCKFVWFFSSFSQVQVKKHEACNRVFGELLFPIQKQDESNIGVELKWSASTRSTEWNIHFFWHSRLFLRFIFLFRDQHHVESLNLKTGLAFICWRKYCLKQVVLDVRCLYTSYKRK